MNELRYVYGRPARSVMKGIREEIARLRKQGVPEEKIRARVNVLCTQAAKDHGGKPEKGVESELDLDYDEDGEDDE